MTTPPTDVANVLGPATGQSVMYRWGGIAVILLSALAFSLHNTTAVASYAHGVDVFTMLATRSWLGFLALGAFLALRRMPVTLSRRRLTAVMVLSALFCVQSYLLLGSFVYLQVSLAILVFYLFPILVILLAAVIGDERLTLLKGAGALVAFGGLALALNIGGNPDPTGILLAFGSAICLALNIVGGARMMKATPGLVITLYMLGTAVIAFTLAMFLVGGPMLPTSSEGWTWFVGAAITSPIALISFYYALEFTGGPKAAMTMNAEPVMTTVAAVLILSEVLGPYQLVGGSDRHRRHCHRHLLRLAHRPPALDPPAAAWKAPPHPAFSPAICRSAICRSRTTSFSGATEFYP